MPSVSNRPPSVPARRCIKPARGTCRLTLVINGTPYRIKPVACDPSAALRCYGIRKPDGTTYHVSQHAHGAECTCPDWIYSRDGIDPAGCKHIRSMATFGLILADVRPVRGGSPAAEIPSHPTPRATVPQAGQALAAPEREPEDDGSPTPSYRTRKPYTAADVAWWAEVSNQDDQDNHPTDDPAGEPDWDHLAGISAALDRLERGLDASHDHSGWFMGHDA
jgi:hypothetical protein